MAPERGDDDDAYCELSFSPNISLIATVRHFVADFYIKVLGNPSITSRLVVATHELLENAVHYSIDGKSSIRVGVRRRDDGACAVRVDTHNRTSDDDRTVLVRLLGELERSRHDRAAAYRTLLARSAKRDVGSGLGLGRIHAESEMDLRCEIDGEIVHLTAEGVFTQDGSSLHEAPERPAHPTGARSRTRAETMNDAITDIDTAELKTETDWRDADVTVRMMGSAETGAMREMEAFLKRLHDRLVSSKRSEVTIDIRSLEFMNSSCFKAFVSWIDRLQDTPDDTRYRVRFVYDEHKHWQSRSLGALAGFAVDLIRLETS